jgi:hypothetical protein
MKGTRLFTNPFLGILAAWKFSSCRFISPLLMGYCLPVSTFSAFWRPSNTIILVRVYLSSVIRGFRWNHFRHFGTVKMQFLPDRETLTKMHLSSGEEFSAFWRTQNAMLGRLWDLRLNGICLKLSAFSAFWRYENAILDGSWDSRLKSIWRPIGYL